MLRFLFLLLFLLFLSILILFIKSRGKRRMGFSISEWMEMSRDKRYQIHSKDNITNMERKKDLIQEIRREYRRLNKQ